jgi:hypothetical protein
MLKLTFSAVRRRKQDAATLALQQMFKASTGLLA